MSDIKKVVLAYSGGLDTSVILKWLQAVYKGEVGTFTADLGQGEELEPARAKALKAGIKPKNIYIDDVREEFVRDFVFPMFRANTVYEGEYLLGTSIARPLIAKRLIDIVNETGADAICHGATGKGNDQVRFELGAYALKPGIKVIAPWREWDRMAREKLMAYAEYLDLEFAQGDVVAINGKKMKAHEVLGMLNEIGGKHGIGRLDLVENRYVGMKSRGCYETPGGTILLRAHRAIESVTLDREVAHLKDDLRPRHASLNYNGYWWSPERRALQTLIDHTQEHVNGSVRLKLYKGNVIVVGRDSKQDSLFDPTIATFEDDAGAYDQKDAGGFIKLNALRMRIGANRDARKAAKASKAPAKKAVAKKAPAKIKAVVKAPAKG